MPTPGGVPSLKGVMLSHNIESKKLLEFSISLSLLGQLSFASLLQSQNKDLFMPLLLFISFAHSHSLPPLALSYSLSLSFSPSNPSFPPSSHPSLQSNYDTHVIPRSNIKRNYFTATTFFSLRKKGTREKHRSRTFLCPLFFL